MVNVVLHSLNSAHNLRYTIFYINCHLKKFMEPNCSIVTFLLPIFYFVAKLILLFFHKRLSIDLKFSIIF